MHWQLGSETRIVIGGAAVRPVERAAAYLQVQVERRTGWRWPVVKGAAARPGDVALGIPGDGTPAAPSQPESPEEIVLWCGGDPASPTVYALAGGPSVAMAVAGRLARTLDLRPGRAALPALSLQEHPAFPVRGHTFANHKQNNTYDKWSYTQWEEYLTEMAAWGDNIAIVYPLHPVRWVGCLPFEEPPYYDTPEKKAEFERQLDIQLKLPALCHELGMRYGIWTPVNDVFPEEVKRQPGLAKHGGAFVCPHIPEARERLRAFRDRLYGMLSAIDVVFFPSKDDGGCPGCEACTPWGPVYEELVKEQAALAMHHHPKCKVWVAQQGLLASETEHLARWLASEQPEWVEGIAFGPFSELMTFYDPAAPDSTLSLERYGRSGTVSGPVNRLRGIIPGRYRLILYPDETHTFRCQYPVVGMDPVVQYVYGREDGPSPRPREMAAKHAATCVASDGSVPYSEGNTDDVNKFVWSGRSWNPELSGEELAAEYARWFFGPGCAEDAVEIILTLEGILNAPLYGNRDVARARQLVEGCEERKPELLDNWRWLDLRLGALVLDHMQQVMHRDHRLAAQIRYRAAVWRSWLDPSPGLRQTLHYLEREFAGTDGLLREIVWTRDKLFGMQKLAVRGVARLQNSYMRLDVLLEEWRKVLEEIENGQLATFPERYIAVLRPLMVAEDSVRLSVQGIPLVNHIQEFAWEQGATTWKWA